ncbi:MAG: Hpt domain-containing protein [bacterium]
MDQITEVESNPTDPDALARLRRFGGDKLLREMIELYLQAAPERMAAARVATENGDRPGAELALHSLKSSSAQLGAARVGKLSERGENIARAGSLVGVHEILNEMETELVKVTAWLTSVREAAVA